MTDLNGIGRTEYQLFDANRQRFIPLMRCLLNESERRAGDEYFERALCPHLRWRKPVASGAIIAEATAETSRVRSYKFSR